MKNNVVGWFEIPVKDMERAMKFYEAVFRLKLNRQIMGDVDMAWFPFAENGSGAAGSLIKHDEYYKPSMDGTLIYFSSENVQDELERVEKAGGNIAVPKTLIAENIGYMGVFVDSEGNRIALHSRA